ncbi:MAG: carbohydrate-binding family 9-like protein [Saprospiraceae bacterium]|nr:carbohydrate-binding family 9-like protein [Saprospiraceae bacterium]
MSAFNFLWILPFVFLMQNEGSQKIYEVKKLEQEININGQGTDPAWAQAAILTDFQLPWNDEIPQPMSFQAMWTDSALYLLYHVIDHNIVAPGPPDDKRGVIPSDRVEIFFKVNGEMNPYYCLELDPRARVLDYKARYYRNTDFDWSWPKEDLQVLATTQENGYSVEVKITMKSLQDMQILDENKTLDVGLFRGDFQTAPNGRTEVKWISWVKPDSERPDFHIPSAFGKLILMEDKTP